MNHLALKVITIDVPDCPTAANVVMGVPGWAIAWGGIFAFVLLMAVIIGGLIYRSEKQTQITKRVQSQLTADTERMRHQKTCATCGASNLISTERKQ